MMRTRRTRQNWMYQNNFAEYNSGHGDIVDGPAGEAIHTQNFTMSEDKEDEESAAPAAAAAVIPAAAAESGGDGAGPPAAGGAVDA